MLRSILPIRVLGTCLALAGAGCFSPPQDGGSEKEPGQDSARCLIPEDADRVADQVLNLVNLERAAEGLAPVSGNLVLEQIAGDYACKMIEEDFFDHQDPTTGAGPAERAFALKYAYYAVGENLAAGQDTATEVMRIWMESPAHRANILDPAWEEIGIAVRTGGEYSIYWVQEFAQPVEP